MASYGLRLKGSLTGTYEFSDVGATTTTMTRTP